MKLTRISTEWADGIIWNDDNIDGSVWDCFFVMLEVVDENGKPYGLQYIANKSKNTERDYENPTEHGELEGKYDDFLEEMDSLADEVSRKTIQIEIEERKLETSRDELDALMAV